MRTIKKIIPFFVALALGSIAILIHCDDAVQTMDKDTYDAAISFVGISFVISVMLTWFLVIDCLPDTTAAPVVLRAPMFLAKFFLAPALTTVLLGGIILGAIFILEQIDLLLFN